MQREGRKFFQAITFVVAALLSLRASGQGTCPGTALYSFVVESPRPPAAALPSCAPNPCCWYPGSISHKTRLRGSF
jgi:hypothetical protein